MTPEGLTFNEHDHSCNQFNLLSLLDGLGCLDNHEVPDEVLGHVALAAVVEQGQLKIQPRTSELRKPPRSDYLTFNSVGEPDYIRVKATRPLPVVEKGK